MQNVIKTTTKEKPLPRQGNKRNAFIVSLQVAKKRSHNTTGQITTNKNVMGNVSKTNFLAPGTAVGYSKMQT